jgi:hypothetical protein
LDKVTKSTSPLVSYMNSTHATDMFVEPGGGPGGSDRLFEAKVVSPCTLAERQGAVTRGQKPSKRGYHPVRLRQHRGDRSPTAS